MSITRLGIVGSALVSEVSLHNGVKATSTGSLMSIDLFMFITYFIILLTITTNVVVMILFKNKDEASQNIGKGIEKKARYFVSDRSAVMCSPKGMVNCPWLVLLPLLHRC